MRAMRMATFLGALAAASPSASDAQRIESYSGSCDASAGISLGGDIFVVGNDENNTLHYYRRGQPAPVGTLPLSTFLRTGSDEADIEGAAAIGSRIYWISSHSRNSKGKRQPSRHRIFATEIRGGPSPRVEPVGKPYVDLLRDLTDAEALKPYRLGAAAGLAAEADGGLNIEGLAATPEGGLLIGFRNPLRDGRALVVPLHNPAGIIEGERARLGAPIELDLGRRGIRSIELVGSAYLIVAGPTADSGTFALYRWSGKARGRAGARDRRDPGNPAARTGRSARPAEVAQEIARALGRRRVEDLRAAGPARRCGRRRTRRPSRRRDARTSSRA